MNIEKMERGDSPTRKRDRPCFWYLGYAIIFAMIAYPAIRWMPHVMEKFRLNTILLPVPLLSIKQSGYPLAMVSLALAIAFILSMFWKGLHSAEAIGTTGLLLLALLALYIGMLFMSFEVICWDLGLP